MLKHYFFLFFYFYYFKKGIRTVMTDNTKTLLAALTIHNGCNSIVTCCNDAFTELFGFSLSEIKNTSLANKLVLLEEPLFCDLKALFFIAVATDGGIFASAKMFNNLHYAVAVKLHCVYQGNDTYKLYFRVSENKSIDPISGLPNGWALKSRIDYVINNQKITLKNMVLIIIEADNFSTINFRYDYFIGDQYLVALGKRLIEAVNGVGFVVRYSNARYAILIEDYETLPADMLTQRVDLICQNLCLALTAPIQISPDIEITKSFSIGVSSIGFEYDCYHSMQIAAETEKQKAKKYSINKYYIAPSEPQAEFLTRKLIIEALPQAIALHQIQVYYQPQYDINSHQLIGLEALSRWNDDTLGTIPPDVFVAITEDIGLHFEFDLWVFEKVCRQLVIWQKQSIPVPRIAINISFKTMEMNTFIERIKVILKDTGCPTNLLELEVTETSSINNAKMLSENMLQVKELGLYIAVDDFGTGYSSLSLIRTFHMSLDKLKLDRSLIDKICQTQLDQNFTKHIIELGKILNVSILAEGVETKAQLDLLTDLGCDYAQGWYFSKAVTCEEVVSLIETSEVSTVLA